MTIFKRVYNKYLASEEAMSLIIVLIIGFIIIALLGTTLSPVLAALVIAYILQGVINWLKKYVSGKIAFWLVFTVFILLLMSLGLLLLPMATKQLINLVNETLPNLYTALHDSLTKLPEKYPEVFTPEQMLLISDGVNDKIAQSAQMLGKWSLNIFQNLMGLMIFSVLVPILVFFFLKDKNKMMLWVSELAPRQKDFFADIWQRIDKQLSNYVIGKAVEMLVITVVCMILFLGLGLNYAVLLALAVGISVIIPYIGAFLVSVPVLLIGYFQFGFDTSFFILFFLYGFIQVADGNILVPIIFSEAVELHPVVIIIAILICGGLWGVWGVFFAIPLATLCNVLIITWPQANKPEIPASQNTPA